nr:hypothetical protein [Tanacetum cinerariifolium]
PTVSLHCGDGIDFDFKISFDESDDEDYIVNDKNSFSYKLTFVNDLKPDSDNDKVEINITSDDIIIEPSDGVIDVKINTYFYEFDENRETSHDIPGMPLIFIIKNLYMPFGIPFDPKLFYKDGAYMSSCEGQALILRIEYLQDMGYSMNLYMAYGLSLYVILIPLDIYGLDMWGQEYTDVVVHDYEGRLGTIFRRQVNKVYVLDFEGLTYEMRQAFTNRLRMVHTGAEGQIPFTSDAWTRLGGLRRQLSWRQFILVMGLHTAEEMETDGIAFDGDFLGVVPSYTSIQDLLRRLCHILITFSISGRGQAPEKVTATDLFYLRSMDEGTMVNVPYLRLRGLTVVVRDLPMIDMVELVRLWICDRIFLRRVFPAPVQAPQAPPAAPEPRTMLQWIQRLEEKVRRVRESLDEQQVLLERMSSEKSRLSAWVVGSITQLLNQSGESYVRFDGSIMGTSHASYQRRTRLMTDGAITSVAPHIDDQPDP